MEEKICKQCGGNLRYDRDKKMLECAYCGRTFAANEDNLDVSVESVEKLIAAGRYSPAESMIKELMKTSADDPKVIYYRILCYYQDKSVASILIKYKKNTKRLRMIKAMPEWRELADKLPEDKRVIVARVGQFVDTAVELFDVKKDLGKSVHRSGKSAAGIQTYGTRSMFWSDIMSLYTLSAKSDEEYDARVKNANVRYDREYLAKNNKKDAVMLNEAKGQKNLLERRLDRLTESIKKTEELLWTEGPAVEEKLETIETDLSPDGKTCPKCASPLKYDRSSKYLICSYCGLRQPVDLVEKDITLDEIDKLLSERAFIKVKPMIIDLLNARPDDPKVIIRYILCALHAKDLKTLFTAGIDNPKNINQILERPEWDKIEANLTEENEDFIYLVKAYLEMSLKICDLNGDLGDARDIKRTYGNNSKRPSAFRMMDEEAEKDMARQRRKEESINASLEPERNRIINIFGDDDLSGVGPFAHGVLDDYITSYSDFAENYPDDPNKITLERVRYEQSLGDPEERKKHESRSYNNATERLKNISGQRKDLMIQREGLLKEILERESTL